MENNEKEIKLTPSILFFHNMKYSFSYASIFGAILMLSLILGYFFTLSFLVTIPLLIIPSAFALAITTISLNANIPYSIRSFFKSIKMYFSKEFMGVYRVIIGLLKALLVFAIIYVGIFSFVLTILVYQDQTLIHMLNTNTPQVDIMNYIATNGIYIKTSYLFFSAAITAATLMFIHHLVVNTLKISLNVHSTKPIEMAKINILFRFEFKYFKSTFYRHYLKHIWYIYLIFVLAAAGGFIFNYYFISKELEKCITFGYIVAFLIFTYLIPYIVNVVEFIYLTNYDEFMKASLKASNDILNKVKQTDLYKTNPEDIDELKQSIDRMFEEADKEESEDNDEEDDSNHQ